MSVNYQQVIRDEWKRHGNPKMDVTQWIRGYRFEHYRFYSGLGLDADRQDIAECCSETTKG